MFGIVNPYRLGFGGSFSAFALASLTVDFRVMMAIIVLPDHRPAPDS